MAQPVRVVSLRDLARAPVMVPVSLGEIPVRGLSGHALLRIYERFPLFDQLKDENDPETRKTLMQLMPVAIVEGVGLHEDPEAYSLAESLSFDDQLKIFSEIMRITNPPGGAGKTDPLDGQAANDNSPAPANDNSPSAPEAESELAVAPEPAATKVQVITLS